jgi:hypothetical protein
MQLIHRTPRCSRHHLTRPIYACATSAALALVAAGGEQPKESSPQPGTRSPRAELHVLFLGNSLTAANDLPALVQAMAATGGTRLTYRAFAPGGGSLEEHWSNAEERAALAGTHWDYVVMQQGPSTRPRSQVHLREWVGKWATEARDHAAIPALYMVWPIQGQTDGFKLVAQSYRQAADASKSELLPVGEAWETALRANRSTRLYQSDKVHPNKAGSYLAALVITRGLTGIPAAAIPSRLKLADGQVVQLPEAEANELRRSADQATENSKPNSAPSP